MAWPVERRFFFVSSSQKDQRSDKDLVVKLSTMESKVILLLATFALFGSNQAMPGLNVNDIYRLIGTIEPSTCECVIGQQCQIKIPYSSLLGINCNAGTDVSFFLSIKNRKNYSYFVHLFLNSFVVHHENGSNLLLDQKTWQN